MLVAEFWQSPLIKGWGQAKYAVHQQAAKLFQQHRRRLKGNYDLNSTFDKADRLLEQKRTSSHFFLKYR